MIISMDRADILSIEHFWPNQSVLLFLKQKGAPIEGTIFLSVKKGYKVYQTEDPVTQTAWFYFKKVS